MKQCTVVCLTVALCTLAVPARAASPRQVSVQVREARVRAEPSFFSPPTATLAYGRRLDVVDTQGAWMQVAADDKPLGWMHESALTKKRIEMTSGSRDAELAASSGELALAGKGFTSDVEAEFKARHQDIDFSWVDRMESFKVTASDITRFLDEGGLQPKGGQSR